MPDDSLPGGAPANEEFIADPTGHLLAIIDDADAAVAAERDLDGSGIEGVRVYRGSRSADAIDATGSNHGVGGGLVRGLQQVLSNKDNLAEYEEAAREGATVLAVPADDQDVQDRVIAILDRHGARGMNHFGTTVVETIRP